MGSIWSAINNSFGEGVRESNPLYRANHQRQTLTAFEQAQLDQQRQDHQDLLKQQLFENNRNTRLDSQNEEDRNVRIHENLTEDKGWLRVNKDGSPANPTGDTGASGDTPSPAQNAIANPSPATPSTPGGFDFNTFMNTSPSEGALTPTSIAGGAPAGSTGEPSGGGPSAPPARQSVQDALGLTTPGPLTGTPGGSPAGNTVATTVASRASSAQSGPLAQISQGSTTPSQTGAGGGSGIGGAPLPPATPTYPKPDIQTTDGSYYRRLSSDEQNERVQTVARANAAASRKLAADNVDAVVNDPKNAAVFQGPEGQRLAATMRVYAQTGQKVPPTTAGALAQGLADAHATGNTQLEESYTEALKALHPERTSAGQADLGGFMHSGLDQNGLDSVVDAYHLTNKMPSLGMGNPQLRRAIIQREADKYPDANLATLGATFDANRKSLDKITPGYDAMVAFEQTGRKNLQLYLDQAKKLADGSGETGIPLLNKPLRELEKGLGQEDIPAYQAARQTAINEIARVTQNPNLVGVLPVASQKEIASFVPESATYGQLQEVGNILTQDMQNRQDSYERQIATLKDRMSNGKTAGEGKSPATPTVSGTPPPTSKPTTTAASTGTNPPNKKYAATDTDTRSGEAVGSDDNWKTMYEIRSGRKYDANGKLQ